jgi:hypothetical protein
LGISTFILEALSFVTAFASSAEVALFPFNSIKRKVNDLKTE